MLGLLMEPWFFLIIAASFMYAAGNFIDDSLVHDFKVPVGTMVIISGSFGLVIMAVMGSVALWNDISIRLPLDICFQAMAVGVLELLWVIPYLYAIDRRGAVVAGPLFQLVPVMALGLEAVWGVVPATTQIVAALIIITGGVLLSLKPTGMLQNEEESRLDWSTIGLMLLSVLIIALIYVLFKDASLSHGYVAVGFWSALGLLLTAIAIWLGWKPYRDHFNCFVVNSDKKAISIQILNETMDTGGAYITHLANTVGPSIMVVTAFNAAQPLFILIIGLFLSAMGWQGGRSIIRSEWILITISILLIALGTGLIAIDSSY